MLVVERMLIIFNKLQNITQIKLNIAVKFINNLHMMNVLRLLIGILLCFEKNYKFH